MYCIKVFNILLLSSNPGVWSRCLFVPHTFVLRPLWHPEKNTLQNYTTNLYFLLSPVKP